MNSEPKSPKKDGEPAKTKGLEETYINPIAVDARVRETVKPKPPGPEDDLVEGFLSKNNI